jgi:hypothetical protein
VGYLGNVNFFNRERFVGLGSEEDDEDEVHDESTTAPSVGVNQEFQPANLTEEEAIEMAIAQSELDQLA